MMLCPFCKGEVPDGAQKCQHCAEWLVPVQQPVSYAQFETRNTAGGCLLVVVGVLGFAAAGLADGNGAPAGVCAAICLAVWVLGVIAAVKLVRKVY